MVKGKSVKVDSGSEGNLTLVAMELFNCDGEIVHSVKGGWKQYTTTIIKFKYSERIVAAKIGTDDDDPTSI
jgi:hypothetical protein